MFIYPHPMYPRSSWERIFKQMYNVTLLLNFAAFIISFSDFYTRVDNTYGEYWKGENFELHGPLKEVLTNCTYEHTITINGLTATTYLTLETIPFPFLFVTSFLIGIFCLQGLLIFTDFLVKVLYAMNIRNLRYNGVYVRINIVLLVFVFVYTLAVITAIAASANIREIQQDYVNYCANRYLLQQPDKYIGAEHDVDIIFGTNLTWLLVAVSLNTFVYFMAFLHLVGYSCKHTVGVLQAEKHPWEKGFMCKPDKNILLEWCRLRKLKEELIQKGTYDPDQPLSLPPYAGANSPQPNGPHDIPQQQGVDDGGYYGGEQYAGEQYAVDMGEGYDQQAAEMEMEKSRRKKRKHRKSRQEGDATTGDETNGEGGRRQSRHHRHSRHHGGDTEPTAESAGDGIQGAVSQGDVVVDFQ